MTDESLNSTSASTSVDASASTKLHNRQKHLANGSAAGSEAGSGEKDTKVNGSTVESRVYGKTPDGTTFLVPHTEDMVTNLLDPRVRKSPSDIIIVSILLSYVGLYLVLPSSFRIPVYVVLFMFWRAGYNAGIGWLLTIQSKNRQLTKWAKKYKLFERETTTGSNVSFIHKLVKKDLIAKMNPKEYDFYKAPLEYNTWLLFRDVVDLILMSDFTCYMMLALSCASRTDHSWFITLGRWTAGIGLFLFNLWVKLDAHRVVKDYAWYWGDFFFLEDVNLTFDGVFEMAPHPMYSIGYAGFYGISLMTASYTLFFCSIIAHACQFAFLIIVENPHIDKTYNPPQPVKKPARKSSLEAGERSPSGSGSPAVLDEPFDENDIMRTSQPGMLLFKEFNITRASDWLLLLLTGYSALVVFLPSSNVWCTVTFLSALLWRIFHNFGLGYILLEQSKRKSWTKVFLKHGRTTLEAYEQWQVLYNLSTVMSYTSLAVFAFRQWSSPIGVPFWPFRYILGFMMIALQMWTSYSIYESLGAYGWFFGDFFFPKPQQLTYSGIYRYLNNPERLFGIAGIWGLALLTNSTMVTILAFVWTFGNMAFIRFVEQPHMQKLYGGEIRETSGIEKTIRHAKLPTPLAPFETKVRQLQGSVDKVLNETALAVEGFLDQATPKLTNNVKGMVNDTKVLLKQAPAKLTIVRVSDEIKADPASYELDIGRADKIDYGVPIHVKWKSDKHRTETDWIGVYRVTANSSIEVSKVSSRGRWVPVDQKGFEDRPGIVSTGETAGEVVFQADQLFWEKGVYEFRYHHNGKHNVMAISKPFEIVTSRVDISDDESFKKSLLELVQRCCIGANVYSPESTSDLWDFDNNGSVISRLAYGVKEIYGVDLAPSVFIIDENVDQLAARLVSVHDALKPFVGVKQ